jgi:hypothetical protein
MTSRPPAEDDPITLKDACEIVFHNAIKPATLRAEAARGRLAMHRIGRQDFVTLRDVREMVERCRAEKPRPASTGTKREIRGSSETVRNSSAQAALENTLRGLRAS